MASFLAVSQYVHCCSCSTLDRVPCRLLPELHQHDLGLSVDHQCFLVPSLVIQPAQLPSIEPYSSPCCRASSSMMASTSGLCAERHPGLCAPYSPSMRAPLNRRHIVLSTQACTACAAMWPCCHPRSGSRHSMSLKRLLWQQLLSPPCQDHTHHTT